jgi:ATP-dependent Lon protease
LQVWRPRRLDHRDLAGTIHRGLRRAVLVAARTGLDTVILPEHNQKDLDDLPEEVREKMNFVLVDTMDEVLQAALGEGFDRAVCEA